MLRPDRLRSRPHPHPARARGGLLLAAGLLLALLAAAITTSGVAVAQTPDPTLDGIFSRLRLVIVGLLVTLASLILAAAGLRYLLGSLSGDPAMIEKAKFGVRSAVVGYALAALAVPLTSLLQYVVGR